MKKIKINQNIVRVFAICLLVFAVGFSIYRVSRKYKTMSIKNVYEDQTVENLKFSNAQMNFENGMTNFTADVTNETKEQKIKYIKIVLYYNDNTTNELVGYIGDTILEGETRKINAYITKDVSGAPKVSYEIVR